MSDLHQHGLITTLHRFSESPRSLRSELIEFSRLSPMFLVLPCHASELGTPALEQISTGLRTADYLTEVVVSMNGLSEAELPKANAFWASKQRKVTILLNDTPEARDRLAAQAGLEQDALVPGKGLNVWAALRYLRERYGEGTVAAHDCDIVTYQPILLERLLFPVAHPEFEAVFAKGYYSRVRERLFGRVTRLFLIPLLRALIRVTGHQPLLDFLDCFRYPLAGEFGGRLKELASLPLAMGWGLEVGMLCEIFRREDPRRVCQVDLAIEYDHKHQPLESSSGGLTRMCEEVSRELLAQLEREGTKLDASGRETLLLAYRKISLETIRRYSLDAQINGLEFDLKREQEAVEVFGKALRRALGEQLPRQVLRG